MFGKRCSGPVLGRNLIGESDTLDRQKGSADYEPIFISYILLLQLGIFNVVTIIFVLQAKSFIENDGDWLESQEATEQQYTINELEMK